MKRLYCSQSRRRIGAATLALSLLIAAAPSLSSSSAYAQAGQITVDMVITMHRSGLPAAVILQTISATRFNLSLDDRSRLEAAGVPQEVISAMVGGGGPSLEPSPEPTPTEDDPLARLEAEEARHQPIATVDGDLLELEQQQQSAS